MAWEETDDISQTLLQGTGFYSCHTLSAQKFPGENVARAVGWYEVCSGGSRGDWTLTRQHMSPCAPQDIVFPVREGDAPLLTAAVAVPDKCSDTGHLSHNVDGINGNKTCLH